MDELGDLLKIEEKKHRLTEIEKEMSEPDFWRNREWAEEITRELSGVKNVVDRYEEYLKTGSENLKMELEKLALLSGEYDQNNAIVSIHGGSGGTEAQDWAEMLLRMIERYVEKQGWKYILVDISKGQEAGIKSATVLIKGPYVFGYLKGEAGVHRLVRISPFDADRARHTSFALLEVIPELAENKDMEIDEKDLKIETFRATGHGGQHVNVTDSAVRIKHLPTGITASSQNERSQTQNRATAMKILQSRLAAFARERRKEKISELRGEFLSPEWGSQIRSYVLHPYKMVKDHRTGYETSDAEEVLEGELDEFIESYLKNIQ